jgi:hypothetical protein
MKDNPDEASHQTYLETVQGLTKIEWMDRTINALTPAELIDGARQVAAYKNELTADVQAKTAALRSNPDDEKAIRAAKDAARSQRSKIYKKSDEILFNDGFKKVAAQVAKNPAAAAKDTDKEFAAQVLAAVRHYKRIPTMEEALSFVLQEQRAAVLAVAEARRDREIEEWGVAKERKDVYKQFAQYRDTNVMRACDMRNPAPNGHFLRLFGQSDREIVENSNKDASVMQALTMMNGTLFRNLISPFSVISREVTKAKSADEAIDAIYLSTLSRHATAEEKALLAPVAAAGNEGKGDVLWTVLNTRQFLFIQ